MNVKNKLTGVTLIELMVVVALLAIITTVAYPLFTDYLREARRADAISQLLMLQLAQEEYRLRSSRYAELAALGTPVRSQFYAFSSTNIGAETYTLTATAIGTQASDSNCISIKLNHHDQRTPAQCW